MMNRIPPLAIIRQRFVSPTEHETFAETELSQTNCTDCQPPVETDIPTALTTLFAQRQAVQQAGLPSAPRPGVIVRISPNDQAPTPGASAEPLAALIDAEIAVGKWRGWLVGRDPGYACEWDMILGPEDEPRDPLCQVVQVWNPVSLTAAPTVCVLAELAADRLAVARALAKDFTQLEIPKLIEDHRMGVILARELTDGTGVVTGTPMVSQTDPRREYQQLYREAALLISQRPSVATTAPDRSRTKTTGFLNWIEAIFGLPGRLKLVPVAFAAILLIIPAVAFLVLYQGHEQDVSGSYVSGGAFQEIRAEHPDATSRELEAALRTAGAAPEIRYEPGGVIILEAALKPLAEKDRNRILEAHRLAIPADQQLRVMIVPTTTPVSPR
jgi:hypothetical protein